MTTDQQPKSHDRFSNRVAAYRQYRPTYPRAIINCLRIECGLKPSHSVADIGAGTGLLSKCFLEFGNETFCVEPNREMRMAAEQDLSTYKNFISVPGDAEHTRLAPCSVHVIVAGHAAHWFSTKNVQSEFMRILKPSGIVALIWNTRDSKKSAFMAELENIMRDFALEAVGRPGHEGGSIRRPETLLGPEYIERSFTNIQTLDFDGLLGRVHSSSMMPLPGHPRHAEMVARLRDSFTTHAENGAVKLIYSCDLYFSISSATRAIIGLK